MLGEYFVDLKPYFADQVCAQFPAIVTSYTVNNRLLAMPRTAGIGLLYYRTDLLRPYGYRAPQNLGRTGDDGGPDSSGRTSQSKKQSVRVNNPRALLGHFIHINAGCESAREPPHC